MTAPDVRRGRFITPVLVVGTAMALFAFYLLAYRVRRYQMPVGFDTSWYVWRAEYVADQGVGALGTALRPGHAVLSATLGALTGLSQLELAVVLPLVLAAVFGLTVGGIVRSATGEAAPWVVGAAVAGGLLGTTRLVGENVSNLMALMLAAAAVWFLATRSVAGIPRVASLVLLVGAGLAHWLFLAVVLAAMGAWAILALRSSLWAWRGGTPALLTESGSVLGVAVVAGAATAGSILAVREGPLRVFEAEEDPARFVPKLATDLRRLAWPFLGPVAAAGTALLAIRSEDRERGERAEPMSNGAPRGATDPMDSNRDVWSPGDTDARRATLRALVAWAAVAIGGLAFGAVTTKVPPHRFLALLVAVPGAVAVAAAVWALVGLVRRQGSRWLAAAAALVAIATVAVPGALAWYREGPGVWIDPRALRQALAAGEYVAGLPRGRSVVFLVGPFGSAGVVSVPLKERTIRMGIPPDRQPDVHVYPGDPENLLAARRTTLPGPRVNEAIDPYWEDVRPVLASDPPVIVLSALAGKAYRRVAVLGGRTIVPGVALLRGPAPDSPIIPPPAPRPVPTTVIGLGRGALLFAILLVGGLGWSLVFSGSDRLASWWLAPAIGCAAIMVGSFLAASAGIRVEDAGGAAVYAAVTASGLVVFLLRRRRTARASPRRLSGAPATPRATPSPPP